LGGLELAKTDSPQPHSPMHEMRLELYPVKSVRRYAPCMPCLNVTFTRALSLQLGAVRSASRRRERHWQITGEHPASAGAGSGGGAGRGAGRRLPAPPFPQDEFGRALTDIAPQMNARKGRWRARSTRHDGVELDCAAKTLEARRFINVSPDAMRDGWEARK